MFDKNKPLLFDGAMGTYISEKYGANVKACEFENLYHPENVLSIHKEYIKAGAGALKTNTFFANTAALKTDFDTVNKIIIKGCDLAKEAAAEKVPVFASIGPILHDDPSKALEEHKKIIDVFLSCGITYFLFETFSEYETPIELSKYIKAKSKSYIIAECTVGADHYSKTGISAEEIIRAFESTAEIDACGFNCTCGPLHLLDIVKELGPFSKPVSIMPNAGYPYIENGRSVYQSTPEYFAKQLKEIRACGVNILGGCCGTTPEYIKAAKQMLKTAGNMVYIKEVKPSKPVITPKAENNKKIIAVEIDSPVNTNADYFFDGARELQKSGADLITIADCPLSRARMDSSLLAAKLKRDFGIEAMPHLTCRDRNLNATKALLMALNIEDILNILVITGDPIPAADRGEIKGVFNFNSVMLAKYISDLNGSVFLSKPFKISAALNINQPNFEAELAKAKRKEAAGVTRFLTQPVYTEESINNLMLAKKELKSAVLAGIMPVVSYKNAMFINNEVAGITVPDSLIKSLENKEKQESEETAVNYCLKLIEDVKDHCDGYYLITPLKRVDIIKNIIKGIERN